jgi:CBS domain-containing protein
MRVSEIMTRRVISVAPDATLDDAIDLMVKHHISGLPVIDHDRKLVGIVSEGDFLRRSEMGTEAPPSRWRDVLLGTANAARTYVHSHSRNIREVMTKQVVTANEQMALDEVVHLLEVNNIKRLPVVHRDKVVGIVSRANLMHALASFHRGIQKSLETDTALGKRILNDIDGEGWAVDTDIDVVVRDGVVDLWGTISNSEQRNALRVLTENTPGVKAVVDHLRSKDN